jgi:hypothetical protein
VFANSNDCERGEKMKRKALARFGATLVLVGLLTRFDSNTASAAVQTGEVRVNGTLATGDSAFIRIADVSGRQYFTTVTSGIFALPDAPEGPYDLSAQLTRTAPSFQATYYYREPFYNLVATPNPTIIDFLTVNRTVNLVHPDGTPASGYVDWTGQDTSTSFTIRTLINGSGVVPILNSPTSQIPFLIHHLAG